MTTASEPVGHVLRTGGLRSGAPAVVLAPADAALLGLRPTDRVRVVQAGRHEGVAASVQVASLVEAGTVLASDELAAQLAAKDGDLVHLRTTPRPAAVDIIRRKLEGERLSPREVGIVIRDISRHELHAVETAGWACALQAHGLDPEELEACIQAMVAQGSRIRFDHHPIHDIHSVGGVPGNSYAPISVAIVAAHGLWIPKTSSRAISSACGTADLMETAAPVNLSAEQVRSITEKVGAVLAWGGAAAMAPADDEIIRVEYALSLDPPSQVVASVLAKKLAAGADRVLIDIPWGLGAKLPDRAAADRLAATFTEQGRRAGIQVECIATAGDRPVGPALGPALEMREALRILEGDLSESALAHKACMLAGRVLEMGNVVPQGQGHAAAHASLRDGRALAKFRAIVAAQGGKPNLASSDLAPGPHQAAVVAAHPGRVGRIDNRRLVRVARAAGAPFDKGAGLRLAVEAEQVLERGDALFTLFAEQEPHLAEARRLAAELQPVVVEPE